MKKFNKKYYIYNFVTRIIGFIFLSVVLALSFMEDEETTEFEFSKTVVIVWSVVLVLYIIFLSIYESLLYQRTGYSIDSDGVRSKRGLFFKKNSFLSYDKMHATNERQGLIQRLFGIEGLYIDSGSTNTAAQAEIAIYESKDEIKKILTLIENNKNHKETNEDGETVVEEEKTLEPIFSFSKKEKVMYLAIKALQTFIALAIIFVIFVIVTLLVDKIENKYLGFAVAVVFCAEVLPALCYIIEAFVSQYDFKVFKTDEELIVSHGLFVKVNNKLPLHKIQAIRTKTNLWDRLFGHARIYVDVVGFDGTAPEGGATPLAGILIPYAKKDEISGYINSMIEGYDYQGKISNKSRGIFPRLSVSLLVYTLIMIFAVVELVSLYAIDVLETKWLGYSLLIAFAFYIVLILSLFFGKYIEHRNEGIEIEEDRLIISSGGYYNSKMVVKRENVIAIEDITTPLRKKKNIYTYRIHIYSNSTTNTVLVNIVDGSIKEKLVSFLNVDYLK